MSADLPSPMQKVKAEFCYHKLGELDWRQEGPDVSTRFHKNPSVPQSSRNSTVNPLPRL